jgi:2-polyprenyl-3-methyl-5-hydroxy-6-metoxy-1,4-benzoquinol methylase
MSGPPAGRVLCYCGSIRNTTMKNPCCPLCGVSDIRRFLELDHRKVVQCRTCTHVFAAEYDEAELDRLYVTKYYASSEDPRIEKWITRNERTWEDIFAELLSLGTTIRDLLDIGAGSGGFLTAVQRLSPKISLYAIESSEHARDSLRNRMPDVKFPAARAEDLATTDCRFDCVTILQCLEHVGDPMSLLRSAYQCLRPGGIILVTVPNRNSYRVLLKGKLENLCYGNPTHLHFFSKTTMSKALSAAGFDDIRRMARYGRGEYAGWKSVAQYALRKAGLSTELRFIARKSEVPDTL